MSKRLPSKVRLSRTRKARLRASSPAPSLDDAIDPPFDPPDIAELLGQGDCEEEECAAPREEDVAPPMLPDLPVIPAPQDELLLIPGQIERRGQYQPPPDSALPRQRAPENRLSETPTPPISVHASWDRAEIAEHLAYFAADPHLARADIAIERGGLDVAISRCAAEPSPDLLIIDTTLGAAAMLAGLDRLARIIGKNTKIIVIGAVNDVGLLRELAARGISEYIVPPARRNDLIRTACRLFADADTARLIAVIGARGGVGASTIAQNLAWSIADRQDASVALVDLDLPFGAAQFTFGDATPATTALEETPFERFTLPRNKRLQIFAAPTTLKHDLAFDIETLDRLIRSARREAAFVVLDLPHDWNAWTRQALLAADDVLIVSGPDLASLRNSENILRSIRGAKRGGEPIVAMSMVGMPQRPEIQLKDFVDALRTTPVASFPFEPELVGMATLKGHMIGEAAPRAKMAITIDALATTLTGRAPAARKTSAHREKRVEPPALKTNPLPALKPNVAAPPNPTKPDTEAYPFTFRKPAEGAEEPAPPAPLDLVTPAPASADDYLAQARIAAAHELESWRTSQRRQANGRLLRTIVLVTLLLSGGIWYAHTQRETAFAAEPPRLQAAPRPVAPSVRAVSQPSLARDEATDEVAALVRAAEGGSALAQYQLARRYERGEGVEANLNLARRWTERAAGGGHCRAMHDLGVYFARGEGAQRNDPAAFRWFRQAAELGVADSQYNLGLLYQQGIGVNASLPEALFWFLLSARGGDDTAIERARTLEALLPPVQVEQARARAAAFRPNTASLDIRCTPAPAAPSSLTP